MIKKYYKYLNMNIKGTEKGFWSGGDCSPSEILAGKFLNLLN